MEFKKLAAIIAEILETERSDITPKTRLTQEAGVLPLQIARLVIECEKRFGVIIHDEDVHTFICAGDLAGYIERILDEGGSGPIDLDTDRTAWYYS